ncbi:MAG TPA: alpha/beta fold hydrolase [Thermoflexia bacterium]|jgi:pimeloyl-ACP methyl ester carboxylesterase|nr:alpha/beta fold hydrolase [Thermoflexia bacterium]
MGHTVSHTVEDGIERIVYIPEERRFETPILMQHGMWHGAWCWEPWQKLFAEWGWESIAFSLPGHGGSPVQRPIRWCTLGYYLRFLTAEVERLPRRPVLMGHSMGGALTQWYLRYRGDLPAAVLVAPWTSHNMLPAVFRFVRLDPVGFFLCFLTLTTTPAVRTPQRAARMFVTEGALLSPEELHARLGPESLWVLLQYNPLLWSPAEATRTPMLWLAGEKDALIAEPEQRRSAAHYGAEYVVVKGAGHSLMMERSYRQTAETIRDWLSEQGIE